GRGELRHAEAVPGHGAHVPGRAVRGAGPVGLVEAAQQVEVAAVLGGGQPHRGVPVEQRAAGPRGRAGVGGGHGSSRSSVTFGRWTASAYMSTARSISRAYRVPPGSLAHWACRRPPTRAT